MTITSKDPGNPAVIAGLKLTNVEGLTFSKLEFSAADIQAGKYGFEVFTSKNIAFDQLYVHGKLDGNSATDADGIRVVDSPNVKITNSEFEELRIAIGHKSSDGLKVDGNYLHDIRMDGVRGVESSDVVISRNYFTDFYRVDGDHADAIQFYTTGSTEASRNITVSENIIIRGDGLPMQGIFMGDETGKLPYTNVKISGNIVLGGNMNGIVVGRSEGLEVSGNTVASSPGDKSWIRVIYSKNAKVTDNVVLDDNSKQYLYKENVGLVDHGNVSGKSVTDSGLALLKQWLVKHPEVGAHIKSAFSETVSVDGAGAGKPGLPGGAIGDEHAGAPSDGGVVTLPGGHDASAGVGGGAGGPAAPAPIPGVQNGGAGGDELHGSSGADTINGGDGNDTISDVGGSNVLNGGAGIDTLSYAEAKAGVAVSLAATNIQSTYGAGKDLILNFENLTGSQFDDKLLAGNEGNNVINGGAGDDKLVGNVGADTLIGGSGADSFHVDDISHSTVAMSGRDVILDFSRAEGDRIILRNIDAKVGGGDDPFTFVAKFTGVAGQLTSVAEGDHYVVMGDVNGDAVADFAINVYSQTALSRADFLL